MRLDFLFKIFQENSNKCAIVWRDNLFTYNWFLDKIKEASIYLQENGIKAGDIVAIRSDFNPYSISYLLALINNANIIVPVSFAVKSPEEYYTIAKVEKILEIKDSKPSLSICEGEVKNELLVSLKRKKHPGLILFSSGSTGKSKAAVHDFVPLLKRFELRKKVYKTITFLLFDHIGGINTLLYNLSNAGTIITIEDRNPENVCRMIEKYKVELLPTSPSFLNMMIMSKTHEKYDLSSLKLISYGTEPMPDFTLKALVSCFPEVNFKQTYGLSEIGILSSKSKTKDSLWLKIGGDGFKIKIKNDILYIKARTAMLGYLNAPSPFDKDGWFNTQDKVEIDGDWIKILGRESDIINVGGLKVYPAEVESTLLGMENIEDVTIYAKENPILGNIVAAKVNLFKDEKVIDLKKQIRLFCKNKLEAYKIPVYVEITKKTHMSARLKKIRKYD